MRDFSTPSHVVLPVVGLTGGIGSGKSTLCRVLQALGVPVFSADESAKSMYAKEPGLLQWIESHFGPDCVIQSGGQIENVHARRLGELVFNDPEKLQALNERIHPLVQRDFDAWKLKQLERSSPGYVVREAAILFESGSHRDCQAVITVEASEALRVQRASARLHVTEDEVRLRMGRQWTDDQRRAAADFVAYNDPSDDLLEQALEIHRSLMQRFSMP